MKYKYFTKELIVSELMIPNNLSTQTYGAPVSARLGVLTPGGLGQNYHGGDIFSFSGSPGVERGVHGISAQVMVHGVGTSMRNETLLWQ